ncbi:hypothetical protein [Hamadaea tsunoensis]|uniref:hypothetical protein n=1 Tax=Hamadaea tsunoensis TaxID=53368 RepID=UPI0004038798|nr:hypothetical protein [Hamadaea tsunoensis]
MRNRRTAYAVLAVLLTVTPFVAPAAASAAVTPEKDYAVAGSPPAGLPCHTIAGATACYELSGDKWWVRDNENDGASAVADWLNYQNGNLYRSGQCINALGHGKWGVCNKNYYESSRVVARTCVVDYSAGGADCSDAWVAQAGSIEA